ncbi:RDD family protein [Schaalia suimastitidis]|uniref:RDD family protein n=1 Tax=Schaalia suimastitidis TaxID=121163 RepID=UPI0004022940|nr:RDD family protein [Schaalia suimastitidis]
MTASRVPDTTEYRRLKDESIVTGAAVKLDIHPASPMLRIAATLVDLSLSLMTLLCVLIGIGPHIEIQTASTQRIVTISAIVILTFVLPFIMELATRGQSLGKWAFRIRVVRDDGGVVSARHVAMRTLAGIIEVWLTFGAPALLSAIVSPRGKRFGDMAAGTTVVQLPEARSYPALVMPPELQQWASHAQILPLPAKVHREALEFLRVNRTQVPAVRTQVGNSLAAQISLRVAPPPPPGTHPERFIAAVLVVLRNRNYRRLQQRESNGRQRRDALTTQGPVPLSQ